VQGAGRAETKKINLSQCDSPLARGIGFSNHVVINLNVIGPLARGIGFSNHAVLARRHVQDYIPTCRILHVSFSALSGTTASEVGTTVSTSA